MFNQIGNIFIVMLSAILFCYSSAGAINYTATNAVCDPSLQPLGCTSHGFTIPGLVDRLDLRDSTFTTRRNGATFSGIAEDPTGGFNFLFSFWDATGEPKLELLAPDAYAGVIVDDWLQYGLVEGTLTGFGRFQGLVLQAVPFMLNFQLGICANGKNCDADTGFSGWFWLPDLGLHGDVNAVLTFVSPPGCGSGATGSSNTEGCRPVSEPDTLTIFLCGVLFLVIGKLINKKDRGHSI